MTITTKYTKRVDAITFTGEGLNDLANLCEAARRWIEFGTGPGSALAVITNEEIERMNRLIRLVFDAFGEADGYEEITK